MATISEAKRAANRENAKKSTGPKTAEGKERSRANAFKHGLAGEGVVKADDLKEEIQKRVDEWSDALRPKTGPERWLVERAAVDSARVDAAVASERARRAARIRNDAIYTRAEGIAEVHVARLGKELLSSHGDYPRLCLQLRSTSAGCGWMIARWEAIARRQETYGEWKWIDFCHAERLLGEPSSDGTMSRRLAEVAGDYLTSRKDGWRDRPEEITTTRALLNHRLECSGWFAENLYDLDESLALADSVARANDDLRTFIDEQVAELRERRDRLAEIEALDASEASDRLLVDMSPEGVLLTRYEHELHRRVHQSLRELDRLKKSRADEPAEPDAEPRPQPEPSPPRNEATAAPQPVPAATLSPPPPPLPSPFRDGGAAANGPMSLHMPYIAPPGQR